MGKKKLNLILEGLPDDDVLAKHCVVPISLGQSYHNGTWLKETMRLLINKGFKITVIICDKLQRHTRKIDSSLEMDQIEIDLLAESLKWKQQLNSILDILLAQEKFGVSVEIEIQTWDDWRKKPQFEETLQKVIMACYELLPSFIKKVEDAVESEDLWDNKDSFKEKLKIALIGCYEDEQLENFAIKIDSIISNLEIEDIWDNKDLFKEKFKNILLNGYEGKQSSFGKKVEEAVEGYLHARKEVFFKAKENSEKQNPFDTKEAKELSIAYVLEESAITLMWREEMDFNYEAYPKWPNPAVRAVAEENDLTNCNPLKNIRIFNSKKQASPKKDSTEDRLNGCNGKLLKNIAISEKPKVNVKRESPKNKQASAHLPTQESLSPSSFLKDLGGMTFFAQASEKVNSESLMSLEELIQYNINFFRMNLQVICHNPALKNVDMRRFLIPIVLEVFGETSPSIVQTESDRRPFDL